MFSNNCRYFSSLTSLFRQMKYSAMHPHIYGGKTLLLLLQKIKAEKVEQILCDKFSYGVMEVNNITILNWIQTVNMLRGLETDWQT